MRRPELEIEVLPPDTEDLADAKAGDGGEPDRRHRSWIPLLGILQRQCEGRELGLREGSVPGFLEGALDSACRVGVLRTPLPRLEQGEQSGHERQHAVAPHVCKWLDHDLDVATRHVADLVRPQCRHEVLEGLLPVVLHRARSHASNLDSRRRVVAEEPLEAVGDGGCVSGLTPPPQGVRLSRSDDGQLLGSARARRLQREFRGTRQGRPTLSSGNPVVEDV